MRDVAYWQILLQKSAYRGRGTAQPLSPAGLCGRLTLDFTDACNAYAAHNGRTVVAGRPTWQACGGSAQSLANVNLELGTARPNRVRALNAAIAGVRLWHIAARNVCDGTSAVGESRHRLSKARPVGQPTEPCLENAPTPGRRWFLRDQRS